MKFKCLVLDHDDTVVNSTETIHHPSFQKYLDEYKPGMICTLEEYLLKNFSPGFVEMARQDFGLTDADFEDELRVWQDYVRERIPNAYPGMKDIMESFRKSGGIICVVSHSFRENILRDYRINSLPEPDMVYGWDYPENQRKPNPYPLLEIMKAWSLKPEELLMVDDLKPGYDMAKACGVPFAAAGWAYEIPEIENFMRSNSDFYLKTVNQLAELVCS